MNAKLLGIAIKRKTRAPMTVRDSVTVAPETGLDGDWRGALEDRQVTVLFEEDWQEVCRASGHRLPWTKRRANLLVGGMSNPRRSGGRLVIGDVVLEITGETAPCSRMDQEAAGLRAALEPAWRGGVTCRVVTGGTIALDAPVRYSEAAAQPA